jgi:hypothetical protein
MVVRHWGDDMGLWVWNSDGDLDYMVYLIAVVTWERNHDY